MSSGSADFTQGGYIPAAGENLPEATRRSFQLHLSEQHFWFSGSSPNLGFDCPQKSLSAGGPGMDAPQILRAHSISLSVNVVYSLLHQVFCWHKSKRPLYKAAWRSGTNHENQLHPFPSRSALLAHLESLHHGKPRYRWRCFTAPCATPV